MASALFFSLAYCGEVEILDLLFNVLQAPCTMGSTRGEPCYMCFSIPPSLLGMVVQGEVVVAGLHHTRPPVLLRELLTANGMV